MSQNALPEKQQALIRVATSRVAMIDSACSVRDHTKACVRALPVSPTTLVRAGTAAGAVASVVGTIIGLNRRKNKAAKRASEMQSWSLVSMIFQLLLPLVLPYVQKVLRKKGIITDSQFIKF